MKLEDELNVAYDELKIEDNYQGLLNHYLQMLNSKDRDTYHHSIRVGLLARDIAEHMHLNPKPFFYAGLMHDLGKSVIDSGVLSKKDEFTEQDMQAMKPHVIEGYNLLHDKLFFTSELILRHHRYQENPYPLHLPDTGKKLKESTLSEIAFYSRILSLADFYDALTTRKNSKYIEKNKDALIQFNKDQEFLITQLRHAGIFNVNEDKPLDVDINIPYTPTRTPEEISRHIMLACALEPLSNKRGCTTRDDDLSPKKKLSYFISAGINIGEPFRKLAERLLSKDSSIQIPVIYDLALEAQVYSKMNRLGGRINHGIIELLVPIVASQAMLGKNHDTNLEELMTNAIEIMKRTTRKDVEHLMSLRRFANELSNHERVVKEYAVTNVYDYYVADMENSETLTSIMHNKEFVLGFPNTKSIYEYISNIDYKDISTAASEAYRYSRANAHAGVSPGLTADHVAGALYLLLSKRHDKPVIR